MNTFSVTADKFLHEDAVRRVAERYQEEFSSVEPAAIEVALMVAWAQSSMASAAAPFQEEFGLSAARFTVLRLLHQTAGRRLPMNEIAAGLYVTPTNVTKLVAGLEHDGLVVRVPEPADRRVVLVELTAEGERRLAMMLPRYLEHTVNFWRGLTTTEHKIISHLLAKLRLSLTARPNMAALLQTDAAPAGAARVETAVAV